MPHDPRGIHDQYGDQVAVSDVSSGTYVMISAAGGGTTQGARGGLVYVYRRSGGSWRQIQALKDPAGPNPGNFFATIIAMSGGRAVITAVGTGKNKGAVYIYALRNRRWHFQATLKNPGTRNFGGLAAVSGTTVIIGDGGQSAPPSGHGIAACGLAKRKYPDAWIFVRTRACWRLQQHISVTSINDSEPAVAIDGNIALMSAYFIACGGPFREQDRGHVYVFKRSGTKWHRTATINDPENSQGDFGTGLATSGNRVMVGAPSALNFCGVAYAYELAAKKWKLREKLVPPGAAKCRKVEAFGWAIALSGRTAVVGAPGNGKTYVRNIT